MVGVDMTYLDQDIPVMRKLLVPRDILYTVEKMQASNYFF